MLLASLFAISCRTAVSNESPAKKSTEWRPLFNGKNTTGWEMVGPGELKLEKGELITEGGMGLLWFTKEKFGNCQIKVVFKLSATNDNSGVFIRIPEPPKTPWDAVNGGYEIQIDNTGDDFHRTGCLYSFTKAQNKVSPAVGEWATMLITLNGKQTLVEVNGKVVSELTEGQPVPEKKIWYEADRGPRPEMGYIGLQNHGHGAEVHFKEVSVAPLR